MYGEGYDAIFNKFWQFVLAYYVILGAQLATLLNNEDAGFADLSIQKLREV